MPRNGAPSTATPSRPSAATALGMRPSPHALSTGPVRRSRTATDMPASDPSIAVASPAGPPPTTRRSTSTCPSCGSGAPGSRRAAAVRPQGVVRGDGLVAGAGSVVPTAGEGVAEGAVLPGVGSSRATTVHPSGTDAVADGSASEGDGSTEASTVSGVADGSASEGDGSTEASTGSGVADGSASWAVGDGEAPGVENEGPAVAVAGAVPGPDGTGVAAPAVGEGVDGSRTTRFSP